MHPDFAFSKGYVGPEEQILWKGKPVPGKHLITARFLYNFVLALGFCAFSIYFIIGTLEYVGVETILGIVFFLVSIAIAVVPPLRLYLRRKNTAYIITDKQVLHSYKYYVRRLMPEEIASVGVNIHKDGIGTIRFNTTVASFDVQHQLSPRSSIALVNIPDADKVYHILLDLKK